VEIGIDFNLDGKEDYTAPIAETHWHVAQSLIYAPLGYGNDIRFVVRKKGNGRAVLADLRLQRTGGCSGERIVPNNRFPVGDECTEDSQCASNLCCGRTDLPQPDGGVATLPGACSACCPGRVACGDGGTCAARSDITPPLFAARPLICDPQKAKGTTGAACFADDDCANGCVGALWVKDPSCADGGSPLCATLDVHAGSCR
jgi:hypothetical protein